jgi:hypothetical protein
MTADQTHGEKEIVRHMTIEERASALLELRKVQAELARRTDIRGGLDNYASEWDALAERYERMNAPVNAETCRKKAEHFRFLHSKGEWDEALGV